MIIDDYIGYGYKDLTIVPNKINDIKSRLECNVFYDDLMLPIFTSPMSTVVNTKNWQLWQLNKINAIIPRNISLDERLSFFENVMFVGFVAMSLSEFNDLFIHDNIKHRCNKATSFNVCIDIANGHMNEIYQACKVAKTLAKARKYSLSIMTGNIANPQTYEYICREYAGVIDYIRLGIGGGANCLTTSNAAIHYPIASLIDECNNIRNNIINGYSNVDIYDDEYEEEYAVTPNMHSSHIRSSLPKIIADGGIRNYSDVIKALALGADYVMIGSVFSSLFESAGDFTVKLSPNIEYFVKDESGKIEYSINDLRKPIDSSWTCHSFNIYEDDEAAKQQFIHDDTVDIIKETYGMSTKKAQHLIDPNAHLKTSEGCIKYVKVRHTIQQWTNNMIDYLKSAMSYTNKRKLTDFIGNVDLIVNSQCEINAVNR